MDRVLSSVDARRSSVRAAFHPFPHPISEPLERRVLLATLTVSTTADAGPGSLRQAILDANASTATDVIRFAIPGPGVQTIAPLSALPADIGGLTIDGSTQPGYVRAPLIQLDGAAAGPFVDGLMLGATSTVRAIAIDRFGGNGISLFGRNTTVADCYIGIDPSGERPMGNGGDGVSFISVPTTSTVEGAAISGNVISANGGNGVRIVNGFFVITGNRIGLNAAGTARMGNAADGVQVSGGNAGVIGPRAPDPTGSARNVISGNGGQGIHVISANVTIRGSYIGTDVSGNTAIGNGGHGVFFEGASGNVGGDTRDAPSSTFGNVISGNRGNGIFAVTATIEIRANRIGTNAAGDDTNAALGNGGHGVALFNAGGMVGGEDVAGPNTIAFNAGSGVFAIGQNARSVQVRRNSIFSNGRLGIDLAGPADLPSGVTPNDPGDADTGPNALLNYPDIRSAGVRPATGTSPASTVVTLRLDVDRSGTYRVEFFANPAADPSGFGEGKTFVGDATVTVDARPAYVLATIPAVPVGTIVTATLSDTSRGITSEFSAPIAATEYVTPQVVGRYVMSGAIVPDKQALLPGQAGSFANVVTQSQAITGVVMDVAGLALPEGVTLNDFSFRRLSVDGTGWFADAARKTVAVARGAGAGGSDRVTITFQDVVQQYRWLEVTMKANQRTGLTRPDVFYFGHLTGETGDAASPLHVTALDLAATRRAIGTPVPPGGSRFDFNRDGVVNALDVEIVRRNIGRHLIALVAPNAP